MTALDYKLKQIVNQFNNNDQNKAFSDLKKLIEEYPNDIKINDVYYQIAIKFNMLDEALKSLKLLHKFSSDKQKYILKIYPIYIKKGELDNSLKYINKILNSNNNYNNHLLYRDKAYVLYLKNDINNSKKFIELALKFKQSDYFTFNITGLILVKLRKYYEAISYFEKAVKINPKYIDGYNNLGNCYYELEDLKNSFFNYKISYKLDKKNHTSLINISHILSLKNKYKYATNLLKQVLQTDPLNKTALYNLCICYFRNKEKKNAKKYFNKLINLDPNNNDLKYAYSTYCLSIGDFNNGWKYFDARLNSIKSFKSFKNIEYTNYQNPQIRKIDKNDKILIMREQGIGEEILFSKIYSNIIEKYNDVKIEADKRLINIFNNSFKEKIFFEEGFYSNYEDKLKKFDHILYAGSLLNQFITNKKDFKNHNYLLPNLSKKLYFNKDLSQFKNKIKIGISWKSVLNIYGGLKSLKLENFAQFIEDERILINLQYGNVESEINDFNKLNKNIYNYKNIDLFNDLDSCASLLCNLDFFITVSNSTAHLAGALGVPTILICPSKSTTYYYWNTEKNNSFWYKNIKVFSIQETLKNTFSKINDFINQQS